MTLVTVISLSQVSDILEETLEIAQQHMLDLVTEDQKEPTFDGLRYHAPCDHYIFDGQSYAGGQYLHDPDINGISKKTYKIMVDIEVVDKLTDLFNDYGLTCDRSKVWLYNNKQFCYMSITGQSRYINAISKLVPESVKTLVEATQNNDTGRTWDTTYGKLFNKYFDQFSGLQMIPIEEELVIKILKWKTSPKVKTVHVTVGYTYSTTYVG